MNESKEPKRFPAQNSDQSSQDFVKKSKVVPKYEKPRVKIHAPLHDLTFLTAMGATGVGVIVSAGGI